MAERKPISAKDLRDMRILFSLMAAAWFAFGVFVVVSQTYAGYARQRGYVSFEGGDAIRFGLSHMTFALGLLFPWFFPRRGLAVSYWAGMLVLALAIVFVPPLLG